MFQFQITGIQGYLGRTAVAPMVMAIASAAAMEKSVLTIEALAKAKVPRRTGRLFGSIGGEVIPAGTETRGRVGTNVGYARFVEFGTAPHTIAPVSAYALKWQSGTGDTFAMSVSHPGSKKNPYLIPAMEESTPAINAYFKEAAYALLRHMAKK